MTQRMEDERRLFQDIERQERFSFLFFFFFGLDFSSWTTTITIFLECKVRRNMNTKEISVTTEEMLDKCFIAGLENGRGPLANESWICRIGRTLSKAFRGKKKCSPSSNLISAL